MTKSEVFFLEFAGLVMALIGSLLSILVVSVEFIPSTNVNNQIFSPE